mmetsp:Transcript_25915/g.29921  ORF Transcript_25915/g.29921 Transcript_25915/m.29921 type:complete len:97 (-) Transcript_25915:250-540(-)
MIDKPLIICGTIGRMLDMIDRKYISLDDVKMLVIDEADQICRKKGNENAFKQFAKIVKHFKFDSKDREKVQICAFSATFCQDSENYIQKILMREEK